MATGEVISFMTGQCGVQTGCACWSLYGEEHGISCEGKIVDESVKYDYSFNSFYRESQNSQFVPRTLFLDLEPTVIDEIKKGVNRNLFHADTMINTCEDAANNFARGFYTCGRLLIKQTVFATRKQVEACNAVKCFIIHHSYGGGTGSGFMSTLVDYLMTEYGKTTKIDLGLIPNETLSCSSVEPYNALLGLHHPMESTDLAILCENEPLYNICKTKLRQNKPVFPQLNQIVSQLMSGITACTRFESPLGCNLIDIQTNIVPFPRIHFPLVSFAPIGSPQANAMSIMTTNEITKGAFHTTNQMVSVEPNAGKVMACNLLYKGPITTEDVFDTIHNIKRGKDMEWVEWCPTGFKVGICWQSLSVAPQNIMSSASRSVTLLKNSTVVRTVFNRLGQKFWQLFSRKAFLHWFIGEGMEEKEFKDAFDDLMLLSNDLNLLEKGAEELDETEMTQLYTKTKTAGGGEENNNKNSSDLSEEKTMCKEESDSSNEVNKNFIS